MIYRNLNPRLVGLGGTVSCIFLFLRPLKQRAVSLGSSLSSTLYTRACQNYRCVYLSFLHQRSNITGTRGLGDESGGLGLSGRGKTARFFSEVRALRPMEYLITAFTVEREENNAGPAPNGSARERTALCLPRTSNCFGWGESAITVERRSRISLRVRACVYVLARPKHVVAVAETKLTSDNY